MSTISVILTTYNSQKSIARTVESILNQEGTGKDFEIELIVVDDCSTDGTEEILKNYDVVFLSTGKNSGGPNRGRNIGFSHCSGDYITISDHDDVWEPNKILTMLPFLKEAPIVSSGYTVINTSSNSERTYSNSSDSGFIKYGVNETFLKKFTRSKKGQTSYLGSLVFSNSLRNILFEETYGVVDYDWLLRLFHNQSSIEVCKSLYNRYVEGANLSLDHEYRKKDFYYSLMTIEGYRETYPKEFLKAYKRIHGTRARYFYLTDNMKMARFYFRRAPFSIKTCLYYLSTYAGSGFVKKKFEVF